MARIAALATLIALAVWPVWAENWQPLAGTEITRTLERHVLRFDDGSEQVFNYGGLTAYRIGWPNEGRWRVSQNRYCSQWPPQTDWQCFAVATSADGARVRFTDSGGRASVAGIMPGQ